MNEVKFPVVVRVVGQERYEWLTLAQANERFVVVNNRLVVNDVDPITIEYCKFWLEREQYNLSCLQEEFKDLLSDIAQYQTTNERLVLEYLQPKLNKAKADIKKAEQDIDFLTKAFDFLNK